MIKRILIFFLFGFSVGCQSTSPKNDDSARIAAEKKVNNLTSNIEKLQTAAKIPALQAVVINRGAAEFKYTRGVRAVGFEDVATTDDLFFLGAASKTITSLLIAQMIDQKIIDWNTTIGSIFPKHKMHPSIKTLTIEQLMLHTSGLVDTQKLKVWSSLYDKKYSTKRARELLVESIISSPAHFEKGKTPEYNNSGYILLGWILEHLTNFSWEELAQNKILNPLGMKSCVFGYYGKEKTDKPLQPWPHRWNGVAYEALKSDNPGSDFPSAFAPAGNLRCNAEDWTRFLMELNYGLFRESTFLAEATFAKLFTTANNQKINLAHFVTSAQIWGGGSVYFNFGAQDTSSSLSTIVPRREMILLVFTNAGDKNAAKTSQQVLKLLKEFVEE